MFALAALKVRRDAPVNDAGTDKKAVPVGLGCRRSGDHGRKCGASRRQGQIGGAISVDGVISGIQPEPAGDVAPAGSVSRLRHEPHETAHHGPEALLGGHGTGAPPGGGSRAGGRAPREHRSPRPAGVARQQAWPRRDLLLAHSFGRGGRLRHRGGEPAPADRGQEHRPSRIPGRPAPARLRRGIRGRGPRRTTAPYGGRDSLDRPWSAGRALVARAVAGGGPRRRAAAGRRDRPLPRGWRLRSRARVLAEVAASVERRREGAALPGA